MSEETEAPSVPNYEETLAYSQGIRRTVVDHYMKKGVPEDPKDIDTVLKALKDMDSTAINDRKNSIEQNAADSSKEVASALRDMVMMQQNRNPFEREPDGSAKEIPTPQASPEKLGDHDLVDGEHEIGVVSETSTDFMKRMERERNMVPGPDEDED